MENLPKKVRSKKLSTRVDLTAMVSVSFLLIIFFMVTIELAKPKKLSLSLPDKDPPTCGGICCGAGIENRIITVLLDKNDKMVIYSGYLEFTEEHPREIKSGKDGIRKELQNKIKKVQEFTGDPSKGAIVFIKPSKKCNFKNLIDILDEMAISKISTYAIVNDFTPEETKLLAAN
ncbi:biopolymer transporter ExbD [Flavobacteriaceae bacterium CRH]|nr:biopolymer transporter ExbD [Flavobacteriaceae bacterium CRH]